MQNVTTHVDLSRIRANAEAIVARTGVDLIGVVKANAYGLGAVAVADAIADLVVAWYVFAPAEAIEARLWEITGRPTIAAVVADDDSPDLLREHGIRPGVWTAEQALRWRALDPLLCLDTGMQRFACPPEGLEMLLAAVPFTEAYTHAARPAQAHQLKQLLGGRGLRLHAAGSALLEDPTCHLNAVRPGLALYDGAARVAARLVDARDSRGPVGYGGFNATRHGVILAGYSHGLRRGPCVVNGQRQQVIEVGMQTAYVTLAPSDRAGDEVVLLGDGVGPGDVAAAWGCGPHEALLTLASIGERTY